MNSRLRHGAIVGAVAARQFELRQEVGGVVDVDRAFGLRPGRAGAAPPGTFGVSMYPKRALTWMMPSSA